jgi:hypothetical protein
VLDQGRPGSTPLRAAQLHLHLLVKPPGVLHGARGQPD